MSRCKCGLKEMNPLNGLPVDGPFVHKDKDDNTLTHDNAPYEADHVEVHLEEFCYVGYADGRPKTMLGGHID